MAGRPHIDAPSDSNFAALRMPLGDSRGSGMSLRIASPSSAQPPNQMDSVRSGEGEACSRAAALPQRAPVLTGPKSGTRRGVAQRSDPDSGAGDCCRRYALAEKGGASPGPAVPTVSCFEPGSGGDRSGSVSSPLYFMCGDDSGGRCGNARRVAGKSDASDLEVDDCEVRPAPYAPHAA